MAALQGLLAGLFKTLLVRLPQGIWLAVLFCGAWVALERHYQADYPLFPMKLTWPVEMVNPSYPNNPSHVPQLPKVIEHVASLNLGVPSAELAFGQPGYGALLGAAFGLVLAWPCGIWKTMRNYSGFLLFPARVVLLGAIYAGLFGGVGAWLATTWGPHLIPSGYAAAFGFLMPILVPLPFWILFPLFPSAVRRQAVVLIKQAQREAGTSLAGVAKHDPTLGDVTKGKSQQEWNYYATVCGVFIGALLAEKRGVSKWRRNSVERQVRKRLNKLFEKGEHGLTAVKQFCHEQLERKTKFTTEVIVGLWLAMQMKGDLNPQRDRDLAASLGAHLIQGMSGTWKATSRAGTILGAMFLWTGVAGLTVAALEPQELQHQLARLGLMMEQPAAPVQPTLKENAKEAASRTDSLPVNAAASAEASKSESPAEPEASKPKNSDPTVARPSDLESATSKTAMADTSKESQPEKPAAESTPSGAEQPAEPKSAEVVAEKPAPAEVAPAPRQWTHTSGRTIQGVARSYWNGAVELERADGKTAFVEIARLSNGDRQAIYQQFATALDASNSLPGSLITRNWVAASSGRQVTAALVKVTAKKVDLLRADGKLFSISLNQLSEADQAFAKEQLQAAPSQK